MGTSPGLAQGALGEIGKTFPLTRAPMAKNPGVSSGVSFDPMRLVAEACYCRGRIDGTIQFWPVFMRVAWRSVTRNSIM